MTNYLITDKIANRVDDLVWMGFDCESRTEPYKLITSIPLLTVFKYSYYRIFGEGRGIVIANTEQEAYEMIKTDCPDAGHVEITELDITKPQVIDHSWEEQSES